MFSYFPYDYLLPLDNVGVCAALMPCLLVVLLPNVVLCHEIKHEMPRCVLGHVRMLCLDVC